MKRTIIHINQNACNGCGKCIPNCPEGAIQIIDGKARLISDLFCDGLGACIGECPQGAITKIEREAEPYDERKVMAHIIPQGINTIQAHLKHLRDHGESRLHEIALDVLKKTGIQIAEPPPKSAPLPCGCPGTLAKKLVRNTTSDSSSCADQIPHLESAELRQWPIQLHLLNPDAAYFDNADLLISADCVAHAYGGFQQNMLKGKILVIFCPKLDHSTEAYSEKLAQIMQRHRIRSITVARMEVPCCGGTLAIVKQALALANQTLPVQEVIVGIDGSLQS